MKRIIIHFKLITLRSILVFFAQFRVYRDRRFSCAISWPAKVKSKSKKKKQNWLNCLQSSKYTKNIYTKCKKAFKLNWTNAQCRGERRKVIILLLVHNRIRKEMARRHE